MELRALGETPGICKKIQRKKSRRKKMTNEELEKENAELKSGCGMCYRKDKEQLTKAKFLLKQLVDAFPKSYSDVIKDTLKQAEQFLNSEVEK